MLIKLIAALVFWPRPPPLIDGSTNRPAPPPPPPPPQPFSHERYDSTYDRDGWHNLSPFNRLIDGQWCWLVAHISESHFVKLLIIMQCQARVPFLRSPLLLLRGCHSPPNFSTYTQEHVIRPINLCNSNQNDLWPTLCLCPSLPSVSRISPES